MINRVQQGTINNYHPAFGDKLIFARGKRFDFVKNFGEQVSNSNLKDYGVAPFYKLPDGSFHANKLMRRVQRAFQQATSLKRTYVVEDVGTFNNSSDVFLKIRRKGTKAKKHITLLNAKTLLEPTEQKTKGTFYQRAKLDPSEPSIKDLEYMAAV